MSYYISLKGPTGIHSHIRKGWWFGGFCSGGCGVRHVLRGEELVSGRGARHATPGQAPAHQSVLLDGTLTWLNFTSIYSKCQYTIIIIYVYIYIVVIFFSCSIFFLWDTVRWSIHFCFKQDFRSWDGHLTWDGTSNARLQGLGSMGTRAPGRWLGYAKFRFYRLVDRGWMDVEGISVTLWDVLISFDDLEGVSSNIRS